MIPFNNLPESWQGIECPGNGKYGTCGVRLRDEITYSQKNSAWVVRRVCHLGHSTEAVITSPDAAYLDMASKKYKFDSRPRKCGECGVAFVPDAGNQILCKDMACKKRLWTRHHYTRFLVRKGIDREEARRMSLIKHPRLGLWQDEKRN